MADISKLLKEISKTTGAVIEQVKNMKPIDIEVVSSGSLAIDAATGINGYPKGRIIEMFGAQSGGKSTLSLIAIAQVQKLGGTAVYIDAEHSFSPEWATKLGIDVPSLGFYQPDNGEQAFSVLEQLLLSNQVDIIVIDSVAALIPKEELDAEMEQNQMGLQARMMSKGLRRITPLMGSKCKTVVIFINQIREKIGVMYGDPITTPGGKALLHAASLRLRISKVSGSESKDSDGGIVGHTIKAAFVKNKVGAPSREAQVALNFTTGVDRVDELVTIGLARNIIEQSGPMYKFGEKKWKGKAELLEALYKEEALRDALTQAIKAAKQEN